MSNLLQLRKHLQYIGHPILGDELYTYSTEWPTSISSLCLWAVEVSIPLPTYLAPNFDESLKTSEDVSDISDDEFEIDKTNVTSSRNEISISKNPILPCKQSLGKKRDNDKDARQGSGFDEDLSLPSSKRLRNMGVYENITKEEFLNVMRNKFIQKVGGLTSTSVDGVNRGKSSTSCDLNSVDCLSTVDLVDGILTVSIIEPPEYELIRQAHNAHYLSKQEQTNENSDDK